MGVIGGRAAKIPVRAVGEGLGVGVKQREVDVEAKAALRLVEAVHAVEVERARAQPLDVAVPEVSGAVAFITEAERAPL